MKEISHIIRKNFFLLAIDRNEGYLLMIIKKPFVSINIRNIHEGSCFRLIELLSIRGPMRVVCSWSQTLIFSKEDRSVVKTAYN